MKGNKQSLHSPLIAMKEQVIHIDPDSEYFFEEGCFILELLNSADDPDVSIARVRVGPGVSTRLHRLEGIVERYLILEGAGVIDVGGLSGQPVEPGDVVVIPPRCPQRITNTADADLVFLAICTPRFVNAAYRDLDGD